MGAAHGDRAVGDLLRAGARRLREAGIDSAALDARLLLAQAAGLRVEEIVGWPERRVACAAARRFEALVARRAARESLAHILGRREFWGLSFVVTSDTLVPRPDSETLVEAVLAARPDRAAPHDILDLGTGTGCLLLALLSEYPNARGVGVDVQPGAAAVARANAEALGLGARAAFVAARWGDAIRGRFDIVVSNPPYIPTGQIAALQPEVRDHEPRRALDGGCDGLDAYRCLAPRLGGLLRPDGLAVLEAGAGRAADVIGILKMHGLASLGTAKDLAGVERCVIARR